MNLKDLNLLYSDLVIIAPVVVVGVLTLNLNIYVDGGLAMTILSIIKYKIV